MTSPIDKKKEALNQLKELRSHCKMTDIVSAIDEDWEVDSSFLVALYKSLW